MSDSVRPHRRQPTRLPRPWDSPGKSTGVGCHFLLQCMKVKVKVKSLSCVWPSATPWTAAYQAPPSMGFSRQEYWSGVPLLSPTPHKSMANGGLTQGSRSSLAPKWGHVWGAICALEFWDGSGGSESPLPCLGWLPDQSSPPYPASLSHTWKVLSQQLACPRTLV